MKKQIVLLVTLSVLAISCGDKNNKKDKSESVQIPKVVEKLDCGCDEIEYGKLNKKVFTGICGDKDQNDTIILKRTYKNGYIIKEIKKEKVQGKYITTIDLIYEDNSPYNGFLLELNNFYSNASYTKFYKEYKEGKMVNSYRCFLMDDRIEACWDAKNGKEIEMIDGLLPEASRPKCMPDSEPNTMFYETRGWFLGSLENQKDVYEKVVSGLQKEFPKFYYIKNK